MGITRKLMSVSTLGLVDFRSDKERTAAYTRGTRKYARRQALAAEKQLQLARTAPTYQAPPPSLQLPPPGWYLDPGIPGLLRWWDGQRYTEHTQPLPPQP